MKYLPLVLVALSCDSSAKYYSGSGNLKGVNVVKGGGAPGMAAMPMAMPMQADTPFQQSSFAAAPMMNPFNLMAQQNQMMQGMFGQGYGFWSPFQQQQYQPTQQSWAVPSQQPSYTRQVGKPSYPTRMKKPYSSDSTVSYLNRIKSAPSSRGPRKIY